MALPAQVQKDNVEIAAYEAALKAELEGAAAPVGQTEDIAAPVTSPEAPVAAVPEPEKETTSNVVELKPATDEKVWEQRYKTLQGMQQAEARNHKELKQQFDALQAEVAEMRAAPVSTPSLVSDEETAEFGADLLDVQRRIAKEELTPILAQLEKIKQENKDLREQLGHTESQMVSSSFEHKLAVAVPDFEAVNADPKWVAWLDEVDPMIRAPRRVVAQAAYERGDVEATAAYVNLFKSLTKPAVVPKKPAAELQSQVAPSRSMPNAAVADDKARIYTEAETSLLFDKVGLLYRQGKAEEASKLDAELTLAYHQGRVR